MTQVTNTPAAEGKTNNAQIPAAKTATVETKLVNKIQFPKEISKTVFLRRIPSPGRLPGQNLDEAKQKIGSGWKGSSVLRGLSFEEEIMYLPSIIGLSPESPNWEANTRAYWANISKEVPPRDGVELEVGLRYYNEDDYNYDQNECARDNNGTLTNHKGKPINMADYILWRYCLNYSRVANTPEDIGKSPKIEFYLFNKDKEISDKVNVLNSKRKALQLMYKRIGERDWVDYILRVLIAQDKSHTKDVRSMSRMTNDEKDILLDEYVVGNPEKFLALAEDKNLEMRSFIELCIAMGKLSRIANTDTITMDGTPLGNATIEVIGFLNNPKNNDVLQTLKAQVKHTPS